MDKLTLFYGKGTGKVKCYCQGVQDMSYFGDSAEDLNYDFIIVDMDTFIMHNSNDFKVVEGKLVYSPKDLDVRQRYIERYGFNVALDEVEEPINIKVPNIKIEEEMQDE